MLTAEENSDLTRFESGTPMGELMRRYWWPVLPSSDVGPGRVHSVRLLCEDFTLFRTASGRVAMVAKRCAHRSADLSLGYVDGEALRCLYHGWCYDAEGRCTDQPLEPAHSVFKDQIRLAAYPVQELAGMIFVYIGPAPVPINPVFDRLVHPNTLKIIQWGFVPCNFVQYVENSLDIRHPEWLHGHSMINYLEHQGAAPDDPRLGMARAYVRHHLPQTHAEETEYGFLRRILQEGYTEESDNYRVGQPWYFPSVTFVSSASQHGAGYRVPVDNETTLVIGAVCFTPGEGVEVPEQEVIPTTEIKYVDATGRMANISVHAGDIMASYGQGVVTDRTKEHLTRTDADILALRRMFQREAEKVSRGGDPMNIIREGDDVVRLPWAAQAFERGFKDDGSYTPGNAAAGMPVLFSSIMPDVDRLFAEAARRRAERRQREDAAS